MATLRKSARMPTGYVRDRTKVYKEKWEALHPNRGASIANHAAAERLRKAFDESDETRLLDAAAGPSDAVVVEMLPVQDPLMVAEQKINSELRAARADMAALSRLQNAAQEDLFGQNKGQHQQVEEKRSALRARIRRIHDMVLGLPTSGAGSADGVAARIKRAKATALNDIAMELNRQEIRDIQSRANQGVPGLDKGRMDAIFSQLAEPTPAYTEQQMAQLSSMQHEYEQRDAGIAELIKEVTEVQEVMRDISVLVVEQGSMIDRIDQNVMVAAEHVERGVEHIRRAHEASKGGAMATCIFVLLIAIAIMFVIMMFVNFL
eukprot:jgi/Ulvmu1/11830/UM080_0041.1